MATVDICFGLQEGISRPVVMKSGLRLLIGDVAFREALTPKATFFEQPLRER